MNDIILLALLVEGPKHGYLLKQEAAALSSGEVLHNNTVYPLLKRFVRDGWITQREAEGERGQTRLLYEMTPPGYEALLARLNYFDEVAAADAGAFRLRVGLFDLLTPEERRRVLLIRNRYLASRLGWSAEIARHHRMGEWSRESLQRSVEQITGELEWISKLMERVDTPPVPYVPKLVAERGEASTK
jgi:DNA-binding PadR family transcriptional regulator